ncbi:MAG: AAA family ATPase [Emergencia sp.]|nr:AAA family ATPase [Emergencia sp.]
MIEEFDLLSRFEGVQQRNQNSWQCKCPVHRDKKASLTITRTAGKYLLHCHAGCEAGDILDAVGLTWTDLNESKTAAGVFKDIPKWQQGLEAVYDYQDSEGNYAYSKLRYQGKKIFYGYIDSNGCRYNDLTKERYLYNAAEFAKAIEQGIPVYYAEGEKDVETLRKMGLVAATAGGTSDWKKNFADSFRNAWVTILADNDEPGQKLAQRVAKEIKGICYCYRIVTPSEVEKGDVTDYLEAGHSKEELLQLIEKTPWTVKGRKKPMLKNLLTVEDANIKWLWEPYIQANNITIFRGDPGVGKTYFICALMSALSNEEAPIKMPGNMHRHGRAIYFGMEDDEATIKRRVKACGGNLANIDICTDFIEFKDTEMLRELVKQANAKLIIFDPLQAYLGRGVNMNMANEVRPLLEGIRAVARDLDCAVIIIEHQNKMTSQSALYRGIGSVDVVGSARSVLASFFHPDNENERVTFQLKTNARSGKPISWIIEEDGTFTWNGVSIISLDEAEKITRKADRIARQDTDIAVTYVKAIMKAHPEGWRGRAAKIFEEGSRLTGITLGTPKAIGKQLSDENNIFELQQEGIYISVSRPQNVTTYDLYKNTAEKEQSYIC